MNFILSLLPAIEHFHMIGYWLALFAALAETTIGIGLLIPGSTITLLMGALAGKGYFDIGDLLWFVVIGAIVGDNINYFIGKKYGSKIFMKSFWFIKPSYLKKGEDFFEKHGPKSVFIGRFIPGLKEIIPLIAGTFGMKRLPFMVWNILGAIGWGLAWVLPGYFFAQSLNLAEIWLTRTGFFLIIFLAVLIIFYILKIILLKKGKQLFSFLFSVWQSIKQAIIANREMQKFTERHKTLFQFIQGRLSKNSFYGLPLTLLSLALIYILFLLGGITEDIINSDLIVSADVRVANLLAIFRNAELTKFFFWITLLGKWQIVLIFTIATILILWIWKKRIYIIPLLLSIVGSEFLAFAGKIVFHRARPSVAIYTEKSFSFPSGHAAIAIAFYGFIIYILIRNAKQWNKKINAFFIGFLIIILIGFSRLYLGVHYVSDVWGGYLAGTIGLIIAISFLEYFSYKKQITDIPHPNAKKRLATVILIFASAGLYIAFALNYLPPSIFLQEAKQIIITDTATIFTNNQLKYTETLLGNKQEPLSFIIIAKNDQQLVDLFKQSDWLLADDVTVSTITKMAQAAFWKYPYSKAPMTPDFWNAKVHDFGFEKSTELNNAHERHHARFWKTNYSTGDGNVIYVGTASFDSNIKWGVIHQINPDIDTEREFLFNDIQKTGMIVNFKKQQFVEPTLGANFSGDQFFTDGKSYVIFLKK